MANTRTLPVRLYLDNNVYNWFVEPEHRSEREELLRAASNGRVDVLFSWVNLIEMLRTYERLPEKGCEMLRLSQVLCPRVTMAVEDVLLDQAECLKEGKPTSTLTPFGSRGRDWDGIRRRLIDGRGRVLQDFHDLVRQLQDRHVADMRKWKAEVEGQYGRTAPKDFYASIDADPCLRESLVRGMSEGQCKYVETLQTLKSFEEMPSLALYLKVNLRILYELNVLNKQPRHSDWADREQAVYFHFVDCVVTLDRGGRGESPDYAAILQEILAPLGKSVKDPRTLLKELPQTPEDGGDRQ